MFQKQKNQEVSHKGNLNSKIIIGYYNLRGKAQVCRLICQYLKVDYEDKLFSLEQWDKFKKQKTKKWMFSQLPFLQEGQFTITQPIPMCLYVITRFGDPQLLGRNIKDKTIVDMYLWTIQIMGNMIAFNCQKLTLQQLKTFKQKQWKQNVQGRLLKYQLFAKQNNFFLGYLTIVDFSIYQLARYMEMIFPGKMQNFPKLLKVKQLVGQLPAIKEYQQSDRSVQGMCPSKLLEDLRNRKSQEQKNKESSQIVIQSR